MSVRKRRWYSRTDAKERAQALVLEGGAWGELERLSGGRVRGPKGRSAAGGLGGRLHR